MKYTKQKPTIPGPYWIRGFDYGREDRAALVHVYQYNSELMELYVNLHESNTDEGGDHFRLSVLDEDFEWLGPLLPVDQGGMYRVWFDLEHGEGKPDWWCEDPETISEALSSIIDAAKKGWVCMILPDGVNPRPDGRWDNPIGGDQKGDHDQ